MHMEGGGRHLTAEIFCQYVELLFSRNSVPVEFYVKNLLY